MTSANDASIPIPVSIHASIYDRPVQQLTHVIQAPLPLPNTTCQAGSNDWKYSSGWKKVRKESAFTKRNATRRRKISDDRDRFRIHSEPPRCNRPLEDGCDGPAALPASKCPDDVTDMVSVAERVDNGRLRRGSQGDEIMST